MEDFWKQHRRFLKQAYLSSNFGNSLYSALPSAIFLFGAFSLLYYHLKPYYISQNWRRLLYKNVIFHWIFFYIFRMWLLFVKLVKYFNIYLDEIMQGNTPDDDLVLCRSLIHAVLFLTVLTISVMPLLLLRLFIIYNRYGGLIFDWEEENPWDSNEMGRGIRYLQRPQLVQESRNFPKPYRSKRSTSFDNRSEIRDQEVALRSCKSLTDICSLHKLNGKG